MDREVALHYNIELWSRTDPKTSLFLANQENEGVIWTNAASGEANIKKGELLFHDAISPREEAERWFRTLDLGNSSVLYVYGVGLGYDYLAAKSWLEEDSSRNIVFFEDDLAVIYNLFKTEAATLLLEDKQARLCYFRDIKQFDKVFDGIYWDYIMTQMTTSALRAYEAANSEVFEEIKHKIIYDSAIKNALIEEYMRYGAGFYRNFFRNNLMLAESWRGAGLFDNFEGVPAIICGAGPSLEKNIGKLPSYRNRALIFGGGSALNALSSRNILPTFGIGIDPNPTQQYRLSSNKAYEVPFFYRNRVHYEAFRLIHGPRLYIPGAGGYEVADWFDKKFDLEEEWIDEGHNVVNFGLEIAYKMGCRTVLLTGVDLAYTEMQAYAKGIVDDTGIELDSILNTDDFDTTALLRKDIHGDSIFTLWKWIAEAQWISDYAKEHPDLTLINCTEGGLGMPGIPNMPLQEAADKYLLRQYDISSRVHAAIVTSPLSKVTEEAVTSATEDLRDSLSHSIEAIYELLADNERLQEQLKSNQEVPATLQSGLAALAETELAQEPGYTHLLGLFNLVYSRVHNKEIHSLESQERNLPDWAKQLKRAEVNHKRLSFLRDVALVNIFTINEALEERHEELKE